MGFGERMRVSKSFPAPLKDGFVWHLMKVFWPRQVGHSPMSVCAVLGGGRAALLKSLIVL